MERDIIIRSSKEKVVIFSLKISVKGSFFMDSLIGLMGYVGIIFLLLAYFMLIIGQMKVSDIHYIMLNVFGALFVVITLHSGGMLPIFHTLVLWLLISLFGFYKHRMVSH